MTHVQLLEQYLKTENAPQDVHNGATLALFALWLDDQEGSESEIFGGNGSRRLWAAINDAQNTNDLQNALYLMGCYLQRFESWVKQQI